MPAIQDLYASEFAHCYGCGARNSQGHQLKSYLRGGETEAVFTPDAKYSGGVPDHVYGGMVASLMDCHGTASAAGFAASEQGQALEPGMDLPRFVTASLKVDFKAPTPLGTPLTVKGRLRSISGRKVWVDLSLLAEDQICATGEMLAIQLKTP
ncbi:PaaI family thioesterase [Comamonas composti]|uniref:PaaI family thioesterase n=1 Tax=Comamonas composti TaxID=408558 RepID=UPI000420C0A5|nr:PaaI family thioesterase [Comamonas composti]